jgi:hypothetical protein
MGWPWREARAAPLPFDTNNIIWLNELSPILRVVSMVVGASSSFSVAFVTTVANGGSWPPPSSNYSDPFIPSPRNLLSTLRRRELEAAMLLEGRGSVAGGRENQRRRVAGGRSVIWQWRRDESSARAGSELSRVPPQREGPWEPAVATGEGGDGRGKHWSSAATDWLEGRGLRPVVDWRQREGEEVEGVVQRERERGERRGSYPVRLSVAHMALDV